METPINPAPVEPKKNNTVLYVTIAAIVLCCCCAGVLGAWWLWNNGDRLLQGTSLLLQVI